MKIFLDDDPIRDSMVDDTWTIVRDPLRAIILITNPKNNVTEVSFDHDLAYFDPTGKEVTGYDILKGLEEFYATMGSDYIAIPKMTIHSANPVGRKNMQAAIDSIERMRNA